LIAGDEFAQGAADAGMQAREVNHARGEGAARSCCRDKEVISHPMCIGNFCNMLLQLIIPIIPTTVGVSREPMNERKAKKLIIVSGP
jgi:hypothetical protein